MRGRRWTQDLGQDLRFGARSLARAPAFTATTILTLALATGATTAIFSILDSVLLRPLPFPEPDRLVQVEEVQPIGAIGPTAASDLVAFREQSQTVERWTGYGLTTLHLSLLTGAERLTTVMSDREFFTVLGARPLAGRTFRADEDWDSAVISEALWTRRFNRDPTIVGSGMAVDVNVWDAVQARTVVQQRTYTILGVMPASFQFPYGAASGFPGALPESRTDLWVADSRMSGQGGRLEVVGRLRPDASIEAAARELDLIEKRLDVTAPGPSRAIGVRVESLTVRVIQPIRQSLWILFGAVGLVLAAACLNVANLVLGRTTLRIREVSTRAALGAGRLRLARQFLAESLLLAMAGGIAGSMVALWGNRLLVTLGAARIPRVQEIAIDWRTFAFLLLVCLASGVLFSLAPALTAARPDCHATLKGAGHTTAARRHRRIRDVLIVMQVALAFVLACGASLVIGEMRRLQQTSPGFDPQGVITFHLTPPLADQTEYYRLESRIAQVPGVESTGFANMLPLQNWGWIGSFQIRGRPAAGPPLPTTEIRAVTPGYFQTLRIPIRAGRPPSEHDRLSVPQDILINEAFARQHFPGENPIDQYLNRGRIVGVAGDVQQADVGRSAVPEMYQQLGAGAGIAADLGMSLVVRTRAPADSIVDAVRSALREANPRLAVFNIKTMEQIVVDSFWELNLYRWLIGCFAGLVLLLAVIGLYGVISYSATLRQNEFAIRLALGTSPPALVWLIVRQGLGLASAGLVIGGLTLIAVSPLLRHIRAGITPEPLTYAAMALLVTAIAAVASLVPALRVARVNPSTVLRYE